MSDIIKTDGRRTTECIANIVLAVVAVATNGALCAMSLHERPRRKFNSLIAAYSAGIVVNATGIALLYGIRVETNETSTPVRCLREYWYLHFYTVGEPIVSFATLVIAIDSFVSTCFVHPKWHLHLRDIPKCIFGFLICSALNTAAIWIDAYIRRDEVISASCYQSYVLSQWYHRIFYTVLSITDIASIGIQLLALANMWIQKSKFNVVRLAQIRRQTAMLKESVILVACVIMSQGIPNMYYVIETMTVLPKWFDKMVWLSTNFGYIGYSAYCILKWFFRREFNLPKTLVTTAKVSPTTNSK
ncbi:hypothetical protein M514_03674 [Trichuris suis]|uniref:G-protein coupled receptors family 1 profile domain-containing protein n=1 Tax=Trichuris suis TaxID=68888 RepID=A0A085MDN8_9BILA|nr:hypothetical protein M513_03674 [Trichuris suis]KFD68652.1 hypothetical protein M514_03674 [Trichuris suis]